MTHVTGCSCTPARQTCPLAGLEPDCYNVLVVTDLNLTKAADLDPRSAVEDERWMRLALAQAEKAIELGEVPIGAIAVLDGQVIGTGYNRKESDRDPTAHAEMIALRQAAAQLENWRLIGVTLFSTLEPCPMCAGAMIQARIPRLVYGAKDTRFGADGSVVDVIRSTNFNHQITVVEGVLEEESIILLQAFFRTLREEKGHASPGISPTSLSPQ
jgi:tRNA(adenine34) deaminase